MLRTCTLLALLAAAAPAQTKADLAALVEKINTAIKTGKNAKAYALLKRLRELAPDTPRLEQNLANVAVALAADLVHKERYENALTTLRKALVWKPHDPFTWYYVGVVQYKLGEYERCCRALEKSIALEARLFEAQKLLGMALYKSGHYEEAAKRLAIASKLRPNDKQVLSYFAHAASDRHLERFDAQGSQNFVVLFDGKNRELEKLIPDVIEYLEKTHVEITRVLQDSPKHRIPVVLYSKTQFARVSTAPHWIAAYFDGKVRVPLDSWVKEQYEVKRVLRHELAHAFIHAIAPDATSWVHEGIAQWLEGRSSRDALSLLQQRHHLVPLERMRQSFDLEKDGRKALLLYAEALGMMSQLYETKGGKQVPYFLRCFAGAKGTVAEREDQAMRRAYGRSVAGLLADYTTRFHLADR